MTIPKTITAKISFEVDRLYHNAGLHPITLEGVQPFRWKHFDPKFMVGVKTKVFVEVASTEPFSFRCNGLLNCEETTKGRNLGIDFDLDEMQKVTLETIISKEGAPLRYNRRVPRIFNSEKIRNMPKIAHWLNFDSKTSALEFKIVNLSPIGFELSTTSLEAEGFSPGDEIKIALATKPRIEVRGVIRSILHRQVKHSADFEHRLGCEIVKMPADLSKIYKGLLKKILEEITPR